MSAALPPIDISPFLEDPLSPAARHACTLVAASLRHTSALVIHDPRVDASSNGKFLDVLERYFAQPRDAKAADERPEAHYQVGLTPPYTETPVCAAEHPPAWCVAKQSALSLENLPTPVTGPDPKWRFFWRVGPRPEKTAYADLHAPQVVPAKFPEWTATMDGWGESMLRATETVATMLALGLGLAPDALRRRMARGPHLLAPTGSDLSRCTGPGQVLAGYHRDLNLLTVHGKARFPGLFIWLRDGRRVPATVPEGHLLLQAGAQLEWLTNGHIQAGMHEVVVTEGTLAAVDAARAREGLPPRESEPDPGPEVPGPPALWRVSSTLFAHIASDEILAPLLPLAPDCGGVAYPPLQAGEQVMAELRGISLAAG